MLCFLNNRIGLRGGLPPGLRSLYLQVGDVTIFNFSTLKIILNLSLYITKKSNWR